MKTLIQKDLRENFKVAVIGLLFFSVLLLQAYQSCLAVLTGLLNRTMSVQVNNLQPLLATNLLIETAFLCAIFGAALGWLQTRNEAHRDLWAFLIHRPVTRTEIFLSKVIAGLSLYVLGAGLPMVVLLAVVRMPGHVAAPFEWAMVLPLVSIFLAGIVFYFAGLLTGLRQARWFVSRSFGLGLAIAAMLSLFSLPEFWQMLIVLTVAAAVLATAVWGAYQSGGFYRGQPLAGRLALGLAMTAGCGTALLVGIGLFSTLVLYPLTNRSLDYSAYQMTRAGTICQVTWRDNEIVSAVDLAGHPLLNPHTGEKIEFKELQKQFAYGGTVVSGMNHPRENQNNYQNDTRFFTLLNCTDKVLWYLDRHGKLIGFDGRTRKFIGTLEPPSDGGTVTREPFLRQHNGYFYYNSYNDVSRKLLPTAKTIYLVDFKERSVAPLFTVTNKEVIGGYEGDLAGYRENSRNAILITTRKTIRLVDTAGSVLFTVPYQPADTEYPQVQFTFLQPTNGSINHFALWFYPDSETNRMAGWKMPIHALWLGPDQTVTQSADLPFLNREGSTSWPDQMTATLLPPALHLTVDPKITSVWNLAGLALAFVYALVGWWLARRYHFTTQTRVGWTLFIFLFGLVGLLALLCTEEWPMRETCPQCKKLRVVDRESCEHCASPFLPPEVTGTEIFAPLTKA